MPSLEIMKEREIQRPFLSFPFIFREAFDPGYNYIYKRILEREQEIIMKVNI